MAILGNRDAEWLSGRVPAGLKKFYEKRMRYGTTEFTEVFSVVSMLYKSVTQEIKNFLFVILGSS